MWVRWAWLNLLSTWKLPDATCSSLTNEYFILTLSPSWVVNDNRALLSPHVYQARKFVGFFFYHTRRYIQTVLPWFCIYREWTNHGKFPSSTSCNNVSITERTCVPLPVARTGAAPCRALPALAPLPAGTGCQNACHQSTVLFEAM